MNRSATGWFEHGASNFTVVYIYGGEYGGKRWKKPMDDCATTERPVPSVRRLLAILLAVDGDKNGNRTPPQTYVLQMDDGERQWLGNYFHSFDSDANDVNIKCNHETSCEKLLE